jgi:hypothetical protein
MYIRLIEGEFFCAVPIATAVYTKHESGLIRCNLPVHHAVEVFDDQGHTVDQFIYCAAHGGVAKAEVKAFGQYNINKPTQG